MTKHITLPSALNLRSKPSADPTSTILAAAPKYTVVAELGGTPDREWLRVDYDGKPGWMSNKYLIRLDMWESLPWIKRAVGEFGVAETPGATNTPRIEEYHRSIDPGGTAGDSTSWCSSFVNWCLEPLGYKTQPLITKAARSWKAWGTVAPVEQPGAIAVFWRRPEVTENADQRAWSKDKLKTQGSYGHVGFVLERQGNKLAVFGGNQHNQVRKDAYAIDGDDIGLLTFRWPH